MKFICSTFGSSGDVFPMLGLALELRLRGHEVLFATNQHYEPLARKHGVSFEPLGTEEQFAESINNPDLWHPQRAFQHVFQSLCPVLKRQYEIHADHATTGTTIGITNCFGFGALMAQDKLNLPVITVHCQPAVIWSDKQPPLLPGLFGPRWLKSLCYRIGERFFIDAVAIEACGSLNRRGILLTEFPEQIPDHLPDTVAHFRYVPFDLLLPRSAAIVHHGGIGSTSQGLAAGIPQVLMPLAHDQFDNAERIARLGVGSWIKADRFTGSWLARHVDKLLSSESVAASCRKWARCLEPRDGLRRAAVAIEDRVTRA